jgi:uncharacterized protein (TIGR00251 family)
VKIQVKVTANSRQKEVIKSENGYLVRVKEPAKEGKANKAVIRALAEYFKVSQSSIRIVSGLEGKNKIVEIPG